MMRQTESEILALFIFFTCVLLSGFLRTEGKGGDKSTGYS